MTIDYWHVVNSTWLRNFGDLQELECEEIFSPINSNAIDWTHFCSSD